MLALTVEDWPGALSVESNKQSRSSPDQNERRLRVSSIPNNRVICTPQIYPQILTDTIQNCAVFVFPRFEPIRHRGRQHSKILGADRWAVRRSGLCRCTNFISRWLIDLPQRLVAYRFRERFKRALLEWLTLRLSLQSHFESCSEVDGRAVNLWKFHAKSVCLLAPFDSCVRSEKLYLPHLTRPCRGG